MPDPHDAYCNYPCTKDHRTRREKIEAQLHPKSGASEGERANAKAMLARMDGQKKSPATQHTLTREEILATGDALRRVAQRFSVSMEDLRAANEHLATEVRRTAFLRELAHKRQVDGQKATFTTTASAAEANVLFEEARRRYQDGVKTSTRPLDQAPPPRYRDGQKIHTFVVDEAVEADQTVWRATLYDAAGNVVADGKFNPPQSLHEAMGVWPGITNFVQDPDGTVRPATPKDMGQ